MKLYKFRQDNVHKMALLDIEITSNIYDFLYYSLNNSNSQDLFSTKHFTWICGQYQFLFSFAFTHTHTYISFTILGKSDE